jgi:hypothetical protein|tara:strand:+ start:4197 stop:4520 length:324 start_codon:yes stop_codon:yes gene_type:complete
MTVKNVISQLEKTFGRQSEAYIIQAINDGLLDISNKKQSYLVSSITDLEQKKRWYDLPTFTNGDSRVLSIERVEVLDTNSRYIMIPKLSDPHKILRADSDASDDSLT